MDMKTTSEYMALLRKYMVENAHKYGIMRMGIFGSVARGEQTEDSDVDVCVELQTPSMFCLVHIKDELQHLFGCAVDIVRLREDMHKKDMVDAMLGKIEQAIIRILNNSQSIDSYHYYLITPAGMERLESTCMLLMAVGEGIKGVDKMTNKNLLVHYPEIDWKGVMGMRDIIAHHYFDLDAAVVFEVVKNNLPSMLTIIKKMRTELPLHEI